MKAWVIPDVVDIATNAKPLVQIELPKPTPGRGEVLIKVAVCGMCHTELDEIEGRTPPPRYPMIPGHQAVGTVEELGQQVKDYHMGDRVGVAWIYSSCGTCAYCQQGLENLCSAFKATGRDVHGGYAEYIVVDEQFIYAIPNNLTDEEAAPLLCAGAIGYRSLKLTGLKDGQNLGLTGFGASAHLVLKMAAYQYPKSNIYVFARKAEERNFALELGATWAGNTTDSPPEKLHAIIDTTPAWLPITAALLQLKPGGRLVINAIRKEAPDQNELLNLSYEDQLWMEKEIKSVANITPADVREFLALAAEMELKPTFTMYNFDEANKALYEMRTQHAIGAKVLRIHHA
jgi:propanol-preferring alcohol dehydrogenase